MVVTIAMMLILTSLLAAYALLSKVETSSTQASSSSNTGFYAAEAGLNLRAKQVRDKFVGFNRPQGTSPGSWQNCVDGTGNQGTVDFACDSSNTFQNQTVSTYVVEDATNPNYITLSPGEPFEGLSAQEYRYDVTSVAVNAQNLPTAILGMRFKSRLIPMFQFLAFYNKDLEIVPSPPMNLNGKIHANGNIYLNAYYFPLNITGQITATGTLYSGRKYETECLNLVYVHDTSNLRQLTCNNNSTRKAYPNSALTAWNNRIITGTSSLTVPPPESFDPAPGRTYWDKADLRVVLTLNTSGNPTAIEVHNQDKTPNTIATTNLLNTCASTITLQNEGPSDPNYEATDTVLNVASTTGFEVGDAVTVGTVSTSDNYFITSKTSTTITLGRQLGSAQSTGTIVRKAIASTSNTFFNNRERRPTAGTYIRMLDLNVQGLINCAQSYNLMGKTLNDNTDGGLLWFLTVLGPKSNTINEYGVRVRKGSQLASTVSGAPAIQGLTIVSDQALYIQGDYNATNKKPAAFLADTINVLSDNWKDALSAGSLTNRNAIATTINAAFLGGSDITGGAEGTAGQNGGISTFNGGLNNYPRLHEDWDGITLTYRGSFVTLGQPRRSNGLWRGVGSAHNIYEAPNRNWEYDTDFNNAANLPPLTPRFVYLRQEVFSRSFER